MDTVIIMVKEVRGRRGRAGKKADLIRQPFGLTEITLLPKYQMPPF